VEQSNLFIDEIAAVLVLAARMQERLMRLY